MKYTMIGMRDYYAFLDEINKYITDGWEPLGGVAVNNEILYQALTKKEPVTPKSKPVGATVRKKRVPRKQPSNF